MTRKPKNSARPLRAFNLVAKTAARALAPQRPAYLVFFVTHRCNARCSFCFLPSIRQDRAEAELSLSEIKSIAERFPGLIHTTLTGGEPFLRDDIYEIAKAFYDTGVKSLTIDTNGALGEKITLAANKILETCPDIFLDLDISIDGPEELHDQIRGLAGCRQRAMETARALAPLQDSHPGFRLGASLTLSKFNRDAARETTAELMDSGLFKRVQVLLVRGRPEDPEAGKVDLSVYEDCARALSRARLSSGAGRIREVLSSRVREIVANTAKQDKAVLPCLAGKSMITLDPRGNLYPCEMLEQLFPDGDRDHGIDSWVMGSLRDPGQDLQTVLASQKSRQIKDWIREKGCYCSFECAAYNNIVFSPGQWPGILTRLVK